MAKSRISRRALLAGAAPLVAAGPLTKLALGSEGQDERLATHLGREHEKLGHAAMFGSDVPAPGAPHDLDPLTLPPPALPHEPGRVREYELIAVDREIEAGLLRLLEGTLQRSPLCAGVA